MRYPIILDLETKHTLKTHNKVNKLGISVVGIYDFYDEKLKAFTETDFHKLYPILENASLIIGYNIDQFDLPVLQSYYPADIGQFSTFDMLEDVRQKIGYRLALNDLLFATLGIKKTGHGLAAIELYRQNKMNELIKYCLSDVDLTRQLFEHGVTTGTVNYLDEKGKQQINVNWKKYKNWEKREEISLTLPF
jgi:DEAD/DEAH box helicase domain-containing protein